MKNTYTLKQITEILKVKRNRLQQWMENGYLTPSVVKSNIQGERNIWSFSDMVRIASFQQLLKNGLSRVGASDILGAKHIYMEVDGQQTKKTKPWKIIDSVDLPLKTHPIFVSLRNDEEQRCVCVLFSEKSNTAHVKIILDSLGFEWQWMLFFDVGEIRDRLALELGWSTEMDGTGSANYEPYPAP